MFLLYSNTKLTCLFGVLRLPSTRFACNQHGLILMILQHVPVCFIRNSKLKHARNLNVKMVGNNQMGWHLSASFAHVHPSHWVCVNWQPLIGVDDHTEKSGICLQKNVFEGGELVVHVHKWACSHSVHANCEAPMHRSKRSSWTCPPEKK